MLYMFLVHMGVNTLGAGDTRRQKFGPGVTEGRQ